MEVNGKFHALAALPPVPIGKEAGWDGPQSRSECGGEEKNSLLCFCRESNPGCSARSLMSILTEVASFTSSKAKWSSGLSDQINCAGNGNVHVLWGAGLWPVAP
jgi:hypothetical protein